jgi:myosin heavy subunit
VFERLDDLQTEREFLVNHYAGWITYSCHDFLDKNRDTLYESICSEMRQSGCQLVASLFPASTEVTLSSEAASVTFESAAASSTPKRKTGELQVTLAMQFKDEMNKLMQLMESTTPLYIRCIKPNRCAACVCKELCGCSSSMLIQ